MSLNTAVLMLKGDHTTRLEEVFSMFGYRDAEKDQWIMDPGAFWKKDWALSENRVLKMVCVHSGWTVIFDPEMVMMINEDACAKASSTLDAQVFGMICQGVSGSYGFFLYDEGKTIRTFMSVDGEVIMNSGTPLPVESRMDMSKGFLEDEVLKIAQELTGVDYLSTGQAPRFLVKELVE